LLKDSVNPVVGALLCEMLCAESFSDFELCPLARENIRSLAGGMYKHSCFYWCPSGYKWEENHFDCYGTTTCDWEKWHFVTDTYRLK